MPVTSISRSVGRTRPRTPAKPERSQLKPEDWIRAATDLLVHRSIEAVRVDVLAKQMKVTRGSFYWHFADRAALLERVLSGWKDAQTEEIIARYKRRGVRAEALIVELVELPFHGRAARKGSAVELAIRAWARRDDVARRVVDDVDAKRLSYIQECFEGLGFEGREARARAFLLYCYMQSESLFYGQGSEQDKADRREYVSSVLLKR
jgi:AcrR family transcriptional regulator